MAGTAEIRAGRAYVELGAKDAGLAKGLQAAAARVRAFGSGMQAVGAGLARIGITAGIPLGLGAMAFTEFEYAMARVKALTRATTPEFAALNDEAQRLGRETAFSARQAAQTMGVFGLAGLGAKEIIAAMAPTLDVAAAGQMDLAIAADIGLKAMKSMGYEATDLRMIMDVLGKAMITANTDLVMLGEAFKYVGPIARSAGIGLHEITAAIQILSNAGIQADMAGTSLRGMILALGSPSVEAAAQLEELGVRVNDARGNFRGLVAIITDLKEATKNMGTGQRLNVLGRIFPARTAAGVATLLAQGGDELARMSRALQDSAGTIAKVAATQLDTLKGASLLLISAVEGLAIAVGEGLAPVLRGLGEVLTTVTSAVAGWAKQNPRLWQQLAVGVLSVTALGAGLIALGLSIKVVGVALGGLAAAAGALAGLAGLVISLKAVKVAAVGVGVGLAASTSIGRQALGAVQGYALGVAGAIARGWREMAQTMTLAWQGVQDAVATGDFTGAARILWLALKVEWARGMLGIGELWDGLLNAMSRAGGAFVMVLSDMWSGLEKAWVHTVGFLSDVWLRFTAWAARTWEKGKFWKSEKAIAEKMAEIDAETTAELERRGGDRGKRIAEIEEARKGREQAIVDSVEEEIARRNRRRREGVDRAQAELDQAVGNVRDRRWMADQMTAWKSVGGQLYDRFLKGIGKPGAGLPSGQAVAAEMGKVEAAGTFSAVAAAGMTAGSSLAERAAKAAEQTAANTRRIAQGIDDIGRL